MIYTTVHCVHCGSHFGTMFDNGPNPTGPRYCLARVVLTFRPATRQTRGPA